MRELIIKIIPYLYIPLIVFSIVGALTVARSDGIRSASPDLTYSNGINNFNPGGSGGQPTCAGVIDLSKGCVLPMMKGL